MNHEAFRPQGKLTSNQKKKKKTNHVLHVLRLFRYVRLLASVLISQEIKDPA